MSTYSKNKFDLLILFSTKKDRHKDSFLFFILNKEFKPS